MLIVTIIFLFRRGHRGYSFGFGCRLGLLRRRFLAAVLGRGGMFGLSDVISLGLVGLPLFLSELAKSVHEVHGRRLGDHERVATLQVLCVLGARVVRVWNMMTN